MSSWPTTDVLPGNATVAVFFVGLMAFCFNDDDQCEVGFFKNGRHSLSVQIFQNFQSPPTMSKENAARESPDSQSKTRERGSWRLAVCGSLSNELPSTHLVDYF